MNGFMLRKHTWLVILEGIPELRDYIKQNFKIKYIQDIYLKVMNEKKKFMNRLNKKMNDKKNLNVCATPTEDDFSVNYGGFVSNVQNSDV